MTGKTITITDTVATGTNSRVLSVRGFVERPRPWERTGSSRHKDGVHLQHCRAVTRKSQE
jgi:hypothetical protein